MTEIGEGQFDLETAVEPFDDGRFAVDVSDQWNIGDNPNGGYLTAILLGDTFGHFAFLLGVPFFRAYA